MLRLRLREWRRHRGLTQEQLAGRVDLTAASISRLENGKQNYIQETLEALASALNIDVPDLFRPPLTPEQEAWRTLVGRVPPEKRPQVTKIIEALIDAA